MLIFLWSQFCITVSHLNGTLFQLHGCQYHNDTFDCCSHNFELWLFYLQTLHWQPSSQNLFIKNIILKNIVAKDGRKSRRLFSDF